MLAKIYSSALHGVDALPITVEVSVDQGQGYCLTGLADDTIRESWYRLNIALKGSGYLVPRTRITINLAPADIPKTGSSYDLPMAVGILAASGQLYNTDRLAEFLVMGELGLDGQIYPIRGALAVAIMASQKGFAGILLPKSNAPEAGVVKEIKVYGVNSLKEVVDFLQGDILLEPVSQNSWEMSLPMLGRGNLDFCDVKGQQPVKRALEIAAAGGHHALMIGPPGVGKSMLAQRLPTILPLLTLQEALETTKIYSVVAIGQPPPGLIMERPFRQPHHTISHVALVGGGATPCPGEISLAHNGVLFLDEMPEFKREVLEVLRQPFEDRKVTISRSSGTLEFPCNFTLLASMNPCPCGYANHPLHACVCSTQAIKRYRQKISGPLLDRIDLHIEVSPVRTEELSGNSELVESSATIRARVIKAREIQASRYKYSPIYCNGQMGGKELSAYCQLEPFTKKHLLRRIQSGQLSARAHDRILKVSRTIADLAGVERIELEHVAEALSYRSLDRESLVTTIPVVQRSYAMRNGSFSNIN